MLNRVLIPCHNKIKGVTIKADIIPENIRAITNTDTRQAKNMTMNIPTLGDQGIMTAPRNINPNRIKAIARVYLKNLTTIKQISKEQSIINKYVIINVFVSA